MEICVTTWLNKKRWQCDFNYLKCLTGFHCISLRDATRLSVDDAQLFKLTEQLSGNIALLFGCADQLSRGAARLCTLIDQVHLTR